MERLALAYALKQESLSFKSGRINEDLIKRSEDIAVQSGTGETALHFAAKNGHVKVIDDLLNKNNVNKDLVINLADLQGRTPLHAAAYGGHSDIVKILLDNGAKYNTKDKDGNTVLHTIVTRSKGHKTPIIEALVGIDMNAKNNAGDTALHIASEKDARFVEAILKFIKKDNLNTPDAEGKTALHRAVSFNLKPKAVKLLLEADLDPNRRDNSGHTALHNLAVAMSSYESALDPSWDKKEALKKFEDVALLLLTNKVDAVAQDTTGKTALDLAQGEYTKAFLAEAINKQ